ncbi:MAG: hypothetical protein ACYTFA_09915 [Planctomycetota bacterium]
MIKAVKMFPCHIAALLAAWPIAIAAGPPTSTTELPGYSRQGYLIGAEAPLFDSVDENFNPVSMADLVDGRPLVLAVSSCS